MQECDNAAGQDEHDKRFQGGTYGFIGCLIRAFVGAASTEKSDGNHEHSDTGSLNQGQQCQA